MPVPRPLDWNYTLKTRSNVVHSPYSLALSVLLLGHPLYSQVSHLQIAVAAQKDPATGVQALAGPAVFIGSLIEPVSSSAP